MDWDRAAMDWVLILYAVVIFASFLIGYQFGKRDGYYKALREDFNREMKDK